MNDAHPQNIQPIFFKGIYPPIIINIQPKN
uniref:Uncharacterized protein n=1 Tax=Podoviridae sp. ctdDI2 TaxID=2826567 RepID=A0A8S5NQW6_9CAUD|nr:MAG TPA: hypothetical protein [Podoviridae sp. ctdDI2]